MASMGPRNGNQSRRPPTASLACDADRRDPVCEIQRFCEPRTGSAWTKGEPPRICGGVEHLTLGRVRAWHATCGIASCTDETRANIIGEWVLRLAGSRA